MPYAIPTPTETRDDELLAIAAIIERDRKRGLNMSPQMVAWALVMQPLTIAEELQVRSLLGDVLA